MLQFLKIQIEKRVQSMFPLFRPLCATKLIPPDRWIPPQATGPASLKEMERGTTVARSNSAHVASIDWEWEISQNTLETLQKESFRVTRTEVLSQNAKLNRLAHLLRLALKSGNISLAMILFSHLEARSANELTRCLMEKVQKLQEHKRRLSEQIQNQTNDAEGSKNLQKLKTDMDVANDDISVLQTFLREVAQNKQQSIELANGFLSKEHESAMAIIRSFSR